MNPAQSDAADRAAEAPPRAAYAPPRILPLGDLRELTLGASPGVGDSGSATTFKCRGCP